MDAREWEMTKHLRAHDKDLICRRSGLDGPYCVLQKSQAWDSYQLGEGATLTYSRPTFNLVFALTDTWTKQGKPRNWGIEPVIQRVKEHRFERHEEQLRELEASYAKAKEASAKDLSNTSEAFLRDFRSQYAKATNDINTSTLEKVDLRRKHAYQ